MLYLKTKGRKLYDEKSYLIKCECGTPTVLLVYDKETNELNELDITEIVGFVRKD